MYEAFPEDTVLMLSNKMASPKQIDEGNLKLTKGVGATTKVLFTVESQKCGPKSEKFTENVIKLSR